MTIASARKWLFVALAAMLLVMAGLHAGIAYGQDGPKKTLKDFQDATIAVVTGSAQVDVVEKNYPNATIMCYNSHADTAAAVASGKADALCATKALADDSLASDPGLVMVDETLDVVDVAFPFPKTKRGDTLRAQMDQLLDEMSTSGELQQIHDKWIEGDDSAQTMPDITLTGENGIVKVATSGTQYPFCYYQNETMVGFGPEILLRFCEKYGYTYDLEDMGIDAIMLSLESAKYDFSIAGVVVTNERKEAMNFSKAYDGVDQVLVYLDRTAVAGTTDQEEASSQGTIADSFAKTFLREGRWKMILSGLGVTLLIALCSALLGTLLGYVIALARYRGGKAINTFFAGYVSLFQGTPVLVLLLIFYYVVFGSVDVSGIVVSILVFGLNAAAFISESIRIGIQAVPAGQTEAALALGYDERRAFYEFVMPQAARHFLPVYRGELISLLKGTSIVGYIAVQDLTKVGDIIRSRTYEALFPLVSIALVYFLLSWIIYKILRYAEKRLSNNPDKSKRVVKGVVEHD